MNRKRHWADVSMSIYDRIQANPRKVALYRDGEKVKTSNEGSDLFGKIFRWKPDAIIGVYDQRAPLDQIEADILDAMA